MDQCQAATHGAPQQQHQAELGEGLKAVQAVQRSTAQYNSTAQVT